MTNPLIERVARAICEANGADPDSDDYRQADWRDYQDEARAAIEAMHSPYTITVHILAYGTDLTTGGGTWYASPEAAKATADMLVCHIFQAEVVGMEPMAVATLPDKESE